MLKNIGLLVVSKLLEMQFIKVKEKTVTISDNADRL